MGHHHVAYRTILQLKYWSIDVFIFSEKHKLLILAMIVALRHTTAHLVAEARTHLTFLRQFTLQKVPIPLRVFLIHHVEIYFLLCRASHQSQLVILESLTPKLMVNLTFPEIATARIQARIVKRMRSLYSILLHVLVP